MLLLQIYIQNISKTQLNSEMNWQNNFWPSNINKIRVEIRYYITLLYFLGTAEILEGFYNLRPDSCCNLADPHSHPVTHGSCELDS